MFTHCVKIGYTFFHLLFPILLCEVLFVFIHLFQILFLASAVKLPVQVNKVLCRILWVSCWKLYLIRILFFCHLLIDRSFFYLFHCKKCGKYRYLGSTRGTKSREHQQTAGAHEDLFLLQISGILHNSAKTLTLWLCFLS